MTFLNESQQKAVCAQGNIVVMAGAGTGKTATLVERCLRLLLEGGESLDRFLIVTFTEAAAAEVRLRVRQRLLARQAESAGDTAAAEHWAKQLALLDLAHISTLHSFCLDLLRQHFYELDLDPNVTVLDEMQTQPLAREVLAALFERHYAGRTAADQAVQTLIRAHGRGSDGHIGDLVLKLHRHIQTLDDPTGWLAEQTRRYRELEPDQWRRWLGAGYRDWCARWLPVLRAQAPENDPARTSAEAIERGAGPAARVPAGLEPSDRMAAILGQILEADRDEKWPRGLKGRLRAPLRSFFEEARFLASVSGGPGDALAEDWAWARPHMTALLDLTAEFAAEFGRAKRELGGVDYADLEQNTLRLLYDQATGQPTHVARQWQRRFQHVFVDEYQDINAAQDAIVRALSREGPEANRFLVGDMKQSIYRFRLANPRIFRGYVERWGGDREAGTCIALRENFRSRREILDFINDFFSCVMRRSAGGLDYPPEARLVFGRKEEPPAAPGTGGGPRGERPPGVELHLLDRPPAAEESADDVPARPGLIAMGDLDATRREARLVAWRLRELHRAGHPVWDGQTQRERPVAWSDMVVLMRSPGTRIESYAQEFHRAGVPLIAARAGFYSALEVMDLLNLLRVLDNPLQDVPLLAVLRSPLVGLSLEQLAAIRQRSRAPFFWTAMKDSDRCGVPGPADSPATTATAGFGAAPPPDRSMGDEVPVDRIVGRIETWRQWVRRRGVSQCLEAILAETHYEEVLGCEVRGTERIGNVRRLVELARGFDPYQRQGLFRFLRFIEAQEEEGLDFEPALAPTVDAVQVMSIHRSKGLEFPVVVVAGMGVRFNEQDLRAEILLSDEYGLCPKVHPPETERNYPSVAFWLAKQRERQELAGEEMRLLYVAMTRARDTLILTGTAGREWSEEESRAAPAGPPGDQVIASAACFLDWVRVWLRQTAAGKERPPARPGQSALMRWHIYREDEWTALTAKDPEIEPAPVTAGCDPNALERLMARLAWQYPAPQATREMAKLSVSELRRRVIEENDLEAHPLFDGGFLRRNSPAAREYSPSSAAGEAAPVPLSAAEMGTAHHRFLEGLSLDRAPAIDGLIDEAERMVKAGWLTPDERRVLNFTALAAFWESDIGRQVRQHAEQVQRELPFTMRFSAADLAGLRALSGGGDRLARDIEPAPAGSTGGDLADDFVVVQGIIDLAVVLPREIWLLDYKTDQVAGGRLDEKVKVYQPQLALYALALSRIYRRPVTRCWLFFIAVGKPVSVDVSWISSR